MSKKLLFNLNKGEIQNYTYVKYTGTIVTATNTLEKPIKNAILKGDTKYRDVDTGEILDSFDGTKNLELVSVKMPVLHTRNNLFNGKMEIGGYNIDTGGPHGLNTRIRCVDFIPINNLSNTTMEIINSQREDDLWILQYDSNKKYLLIDSSFNIPRGVCKQKLNLDSNCAFIRFYEVGVTRLDLGVEYIVSDKSNILRVSNDLTLRSKDTTFDELNILTGKLTQRIDEDGEILNEEIISFVELTITDQDDNIINQINSFDNTTHIITSSDTIPPTFEGYIATKESVE